MLLKLILFIVMLCILGFILLLFALTGITALLLILPSTIATIITVYLLNNLTNNWFITDTDSLFPSSLKALWQLDNHTMLSNIAIYLIILVYMTLGAYIVYVISKRSKKESENVPSGSPSRG